MNKLERREYIIECAKSVFVERGFHGTCVQDIILKARIARSTFYAHFTSKFEIFSILVDSFTEILTGAILNINISMAEEQSNLAGEIRVMTIPLIEAIESNTDLTKLLITAPQGHDSNFDIKISEFYSGILDAVRRLLKEGMDDGNIKIMDADIISYVILGSVKQILLQWLVYAEVSDIRQVLNDIIRYNLYGIAMEKPSISPSL